MNLVYAQESRRILDRLFGFLVSKILWSNIKGKLSAGRVQSPAIKIIIDKERERLKFIQNQLRFCGSKSKSILNQLVGNYLATIFQLLRIDFF